MVIVHAINAIVEDTYMYTFSMHNGKNESTSG